MVTFNDPNQSVNTLTRALMQEFDQTLSEIESDSRINSWVLKSSKKGCFIAGADINMMNDATSTAEVEEIVEAGHKLFHRLANCSKPSVAAIDGVCLGGGLEVALACNYRIASTGPKTAMSLPEIKLGLLPGGGGTQRLPKVVGLVEALKMATTGCNVVPKKAKRSGLVDQLADPFALEGAAVQAAKDLANGKIKRTGRRKKKLMDRIMEDTPARNIVFKKTREQIQKLTGGKYPAPFAIADCIEAGFKSSSAGYAKEKTEFARLSQTPEAKALMGLYFGTVQLKKNRFGKPKSKVERVAVLGAGLMGAGIAEVSAPGFEVMLKDSFAAGLSRGQQQIADNLDKKVKRRRMTKSERDIVEAKIIGVTEDMDGHNKLLSRADLIIEAVPESMEIKHAVIKAAEEHINEDAVFATNTSALPINEVAAGSARPENVVGMHYFSPVPQMPLLEIITHDKTSNETAARAVDVGLRQKKTVIVVKDVPGFYVNRCLGPYMAETSALLLDGVQPEALDKALTSFGFPVGPISLADEVGIDVAGHVQEFLSADKTLGNRMGGGSTKALHAMIDQGMLGRKSGSGFYTYAKGAKKGSKPLNPKVKPILEEARAGREALKLTTEEIQERMVFRFVNEAAFCLQDGIIENAVDGDIGLVFGVGFPPFLGGPFRYLDQIGVGTFVSKMKEYEQKYGPHFAPCPLLVEHAEANKKFH